jgi:hypothetical protein
MHATGAAAQDAFFSHELARCDERLGVVHLHDVINYAEVDGLDQVVFADTFDIVDARFGHSFVVKVVVEHAADRVNTDHLHSGILLLEVAANPANGAAGSNATDKGIDGSAGLLPNFGASALVVRQRVERIVVLIRVDRVWDLLRQLASHAVVAAPSTAVGATTTSVPKARMRAIFSRLILSGIVTTHRRPRTAATMLIAAPVFPEEFSTRIES